MDPTPQHFASDNYSGVCPEVWAAMEAANQGHEPAYGEDAWTRRPADALRALFETDCEGYFAFNGTAANSSTPDELSARAATYARVERPGHISLLGKNRRICDRPQRFAEGHMSKVSTCLWFGKDAETAVSSYVSIVPESKIDHILRAPGPWPGGEAGVVLLIGFTLAGQSFQALNGGAPADYGTAASISVQCADQAGVDRLWAALTADGGSEIMCGWLRDRWGVPWQIVPEILPRLLAHPDPAVAARVFAAMQGMVKLDVAALERAAAV